MLREANVVLVLWTESYTVLPLTLTRKGHSHCRSADEYLILLFVAGVNRSRGDGRVKNIANKTRDRTLVPRLRSLARHSVLSLLYACNSRVQNGAAHEEKGFELQAPVNRAPVANLGL